jgi:chromosome segregation protein
LQDDLREAERAREETEAHLSHDQTLLATLAEELDMLGPEQETSMAAAEESAIALEEAEQAMQAWQQNWESFNQRSAAPQREADVQQSRIRHLEQSLERLVDRERRLRDELTQLAADPEGAALLELAEELTGVELILEELAQDEEEKAERLVAGREALQNLTVRYTDSQGNLQRLEGRIASLEALQQAALNPGQGASEWMRQHNLHERSRLAEGVRVEAGWERAVETVLGADLQAVCLDDLSGLDLDLFEQGELRLALSDKATVAAPRSLMEKVEAPHDLSPWLGGVFPVETLDDALAQREQLTTGQSLVSRDGYWVSRHFLRVQRSSEAESGLLVRGQELEQLLAEREHLEQLLHEEQRALEVAHNQLAVLERDRELLRRRLQEEGRRQGEVKAQLSARQAKAEQLSLRRQRLEEERLELAEQRAVETEQIGEARLSLQDALDAMAEDTSLREQMVTKRELLRERLDQARQQSRQHKDQAHQLAVRLGSLKAQHDSTRQALERLVLQASRLEERREQLSLTLEEGSAPIEELRMKLEELLERRTRVDEELRSARMALEDADRELRESERRRTQAEQQAQVVRTQVEQQRLEWQGLSVRRKTLQEQLLEEGYVLEAVIATLPQDATESSWEAQLESLAARIQRLGAINLAAIEEYQQQSERKRYLDSQNDDLVEALDTLENVIRKIDRETRNRFKDTFDQINNGLQALFPKVFGGGHAYLELTGEDLLDTGVAIMARPPGKKNSTIHLLSGGEKALTAIALVFAIFQLNPAPFCMLDEVDAPLDDANVGRYARLVKEMSEKVQFIYITHNKIAMEMADQLMGVTMHEPGCSRLVAVDVEEAVALAEA